MQWQEACENPNLKNLPFKIELNHQGELLTSLVKVNHSILQENYRSFFQQRALEFWLCDSVGNMSFFTETQALRYY